MKHHETGGGRQGPSETREPAGERAEGESIPARSAAGATRRQRGEPSLGSRNVNRAGPGGGRHTRCQGRGRPEVDATRSPADVFADRRPGFLGHRPPAGTRGVIVSTTRTSPSLASSLVTGPRSTTLIPISDRSLGERGGISCGRAARLRHRQSEPAGEDRGLAVASRIRSRRAPLERESAWSTRIAPRDSSLTAMVAPPGATVVVWKFGRSRRAGTQLVDTR